MDGKKRANIIAESRNNVFDRQLDLAWLELKISGSRFAAASEISQKIENLTIKTKQDRVAGLEIADAIVTPIARHVLKRKSRIDFDIIKQKMRKDSRGRIEDYGLVVLPK